ncbi:MAG: dihydrodipicolinate synthase family protein [Owenweeksia sp.]|nr:dihydrodipicolinate synthase family protein [Owenweeksia sp.]
MKEASGDMEQIMQIIDQRPEGFLVISGEDNLTLPMMACGGEGVISVSVQGFPQVYSDMVRQALAGDFRAARKEHYKLFKITKMLFAEGSPGGIKAVLEEKGICQAYMRLPLWPISNGLRQNIIAEMAEQGI